VTPEVTEIDERATVYLLFNLAAGSWGYYVVSVRPDLQEHIGFGGDLATERPVVAGDQ
jgi:hypothetical protein